MLLRPKTETTNHTKHTKKFVWRDRQKRPTAQIEQWFFYCLFNPLSGKFAVMSFSPFNWIRDLFGIRKDLIEAEKALVDTEKASLEIEKLESDKSERDLISRPTQEQIEKYDPKTKAIKEKAEAESRFEALEKRLTIIIIRTIIIVNLLLQLIYLVAMEIKSYLFR